MNTRRNFVARSRHSRTCKKNFCVVFQRFTALYLNEALLGPNFYTPGPTARRVQHL